MAQFTKGVVLDEVQRVPELLSWIQVRVDEHKTAGEFILTGRTTLLKLLPLSVAELSDAGQPTGVDHLLLAGGYPRILSRSKASRISPIEINKRYSCLIIRT